MNSATYIQNSKIFPTQNEIQKLSSDKIKLNPTIVKFQMDTENEEDHSHYNNLQFIVDRNTGTIIYAQNGVVYHTEQSEDYKSGANFIQLVFGHHWETASIKKPEVLCGNDTFGATAPTAYLKNLEKLKVT